MAKLIHCSRVLVGPWGSHRFQNEIISAVSEMRQVLSPDHEFIAGDLELIAKEAGFQDSEWNPESALDILLEQSGVLTAPQDVGNLSWHP